MVVKEQQQAEQLIIAYREGQRDFRAFDFGARDFGGINLSGTDLRGCNFWGADLRCAKLENSDLRGCNFKKANLRGVTFLEADLREANLTDADLSYADLRKANLTQTTWVRVRAGRTLLTGATLPDGQEWLIKSHLGNRFWEEKELSTEYQKRRQSRIGLVSFGFGIFLFIALEGFNFLLGFWICQ